MEYERRGVTLTWQIEKPKFNCKMFSLFYSPVFCVNVMEGTKWRLMLHRGTFESTFLVNIKREYDDNGPEYFGLDCEFSVEQSDRTFSTQEKANSFEFKKGSEYELIKVKFSDNNNFTIRCKIYRQLGSITKSAHFFAGTKMMAESCIFNEIIENFQALSKYQRKTLKIVSSSTGEKLVKINFFLSDHQIRSVDFTSLNIEFIPMSEKMQLFHYKVFIMDSLRNKWERVVQKDAIYPTSIVQTSFSEVSKQHLGRCATRYLPNDTLTLRCELTFYSKTECEKVELLEAKQTNVPNALEHLTSEKGIACDMNLKTATEIFPVHSSILSAGSPVFESIFKTDMNVIIQNWVHIDDVDSETLKRMLVFLYSDSLEELEWKDAMNLYVAADKYQVLSLKNRCTALLHQSIGLSNCCVLFLLADEHKDEFLKKVVQNFISNCQNQVLYCDQWRDLEKNHPHVALAYLRELFL